MVAAPAKLLKGSTALSSAKLSKNLIVTGELNDILMPNDAQNIVCPWPSTGKQSDNFKETSSERKQKKALINIIFKTIKGGQLERQIELDIMPAL